MDEPRAGKRISRWFRRVWRKRVMRSGLVTGLILSIAALTFILAYRQHMQGNFHKLKQRMATERPQAAIPLPGGQEAIELARMRMMDDTAPEFLSVKLLPGRGMDVLQIRAYVPRTGAMDLLESPTVEEAAVAMTGKGADAEGRFSLKAGGAFEVPWADSIWGVSSEAHGRSTIEWEGHPIALSAPDLPWEGGLMLEAQSDSSNTSMLPDGGQAEATFHGFGGRWPSTSDVTIAALLSSHTVDLTVTVRNTGNSAAPVGIGWTPRFAIAAGARAQLRMHVPGESIVERSKQQTGLPTGKLLPVARTALDFTSPAGAPLPEGGLDQCFTDLTQGVMDNGPVAELSDPIGGYKLRITALSPEIKAMRVMAPADGRYVSIDPQYNYPDPFGHEWDKAGGTGMVVLQPGQSTKWKVRLEILPLDENSASL